MQFPKVEDDCKVYITMPKQFDDANLEGFGASIYVAGPFDTYEEASEHWPSEAPATGEIAYSMRSDDFKEFWDDVGLREKFMNGELQIPDLIKREAETDPSIDLDERMRGYEMKVSEYQQMKALKELMMQVKGE